ARFSRTGEENSRLSRRASFSLDAILAVACHPAFRSHRRGGGTHADEVWRAADAFVAEVAQPAAAALGAAAAARAGDAGVCRGNPLPIGRLHRHLAAVPVVLPPRGLGISGDCCLLDT